MSITINRLLGLSLLSLCFLPECKAQTAAEVVFYHHRSRSHDNSQQQYHFPLYPVGDEVPNLPKSLAKEETDLKIIQKYYNDVATAFRVAAEQLEDRGSSDLEKIKLKQAQISWASLRTGEKSPLTRGIGDTSSASKMDTQTDKAKRIDINNKSQTYSKSLEDANMLRAKSEFYAELADTADQLKEGIMQN